MLMPTVPDDVFDGGKHWPNNAEGNTDGRSNISDSSAHLQALKYPKSPQNYPRFIGNSTHRSVSLYLDLATHLTTFSNRKVKWGVTGGASP